MTAKASGRSSSSCTSTTTTTSVRVSGRPRLVGVYLDVPDVDWDHVEAIVADAWRTVAPPMIRRLAD